MKLSNYSGLNIDEIRKNLEERQKRLNTYKRLNTTEITANITLANGIAGAIRSAREQSLKSQDKLIGTPHLLLGII